MSRWFRHYAGMMRDDKLVRVAIRSKQTIERVVWIWGAILESASEIDDGGRFDFDTAEAAYFLRADEADVARVVGLLAASDRIAEDRVVKWGERQFQSDRSAGRQAAYRERKRSKELPSDACETAPRDGVTSLSRHGDAPETETELDTELVKTEAKASSKILQREKLEAVGSCLRVAFPPPPEVAEGVWADFLRSPKRRKAGMSQTAYAGICRNLIELAEHGFPPGEMIALAVERGWTTVKLDWVLNTDERKPRHGQSTSNVTSLRGSRPDPALDLYRAACAAEDREDNLRVGPSLPALGSGGP